MVEYFKGIGGRTIYGVAIGIICNDKSMYPRFPGDASNMSTYPFPVVFKCYQTNVEMIANRDPELLRNWIDAVTEFEKVGVRAIMTSCGFSIVWQEELAKAAKVPVFASSLLQLPLVQKMLPKGKKMGIITANGKVFNEHKDDLLSCAGIDPSTPIVIEGLEGKEGWDGILKRNPFLDQEKIEKEVVEVTKKMVSENPDIGAIVFECHILPTYGKAVQDATGLPVFDIMTLVDMVYGAIIKKRYCGFM